MPLTACSTFPATGTSAIWPIPARRGRVAGATARQTTGLCLACQVFACRTRAGPAEGLIYLHGGGNFGDIWPAYQTYREAVLQQNPSQRIVQLPQSLHFSDPAAILRTQRAIAAHRDFHLMVRDRESFDFAEPAFRLPGLSGARQRLRHRDGRGAACGPAAGHQVPVPRRQGTPCRCRGRPGLVR